MKKFNPISIITQPYILQHPALNPYYTYEWEASYTNVMIIETISLISKAKKHLKKKIMNDLKNASNAAVPIPQ